MGICGEHGGEPSSVAFFAEAGLDYVSCSPFRLATSISFLLCAPKHKAIYSAKEKHKAIYYNPDFGSDFRNLSMFSNRVPIARLAAAQVAM